MLAAIALLTACAAQPDSIRRRSAGIAAHELSDVPFFAQEEYQCGPAALATVLAYSGVATTADALEPRMYLPARRGSLQMELVAAARQFERVPYVIDGSLGAIRAELRAGRPVLVLQNLGLRTFPRWHYAVVVGTDEAARALILRSGTHARLMMSERRFARSWSRADGWAMVVLRPGELPERPDRTRLTAAAAALESLGRLESARSTFLAITRQWPEDATAWFGLGNTEYRLGARVPAELAYRRVLEHDPTHAAALNNLAQLMTDRGCPSEARALIVRARAAAGPPSFANAIEATAAALADSPDANATCEPMDAPFPR